MNYLSILFWAIAGSVEGLLLVLHLGVPPGSAQGTICNAGDGCTLPSVPSFQVPLSFLIWKSGEHALRMWSNPSLSSRMKIFLPSVGFVFVDFWVSNDWILVPASSPRSTEAESPHCLLGRTWPHGLSGLLEQKSIGAQWNHSDLWTGS